MRSTVRSRPFLVLLLFGAACTPDASEPESSPGKALLPEPGRVRMTVSSPDPETAKQLGHVQGFPTVCVTLEYAGPKTAVDIRTEFLRKGRILTRGADEMSLELPASEQLAISLREETIKGGEEVMKAVHVFGPGKSTVTGNSSISLKNMPWWVREPDPTGEWSDDQEAFLWAVFVGEKPDGADAKPVEELLKQADAAWHFKLVMK